MISEELLHNLREAGEDWADKKAAAEVLEEGRRNLLANLIKKRMAMGDSNAKAQEEARCYLDFEIATDKMLYAQGEAIKAKLAYDLAQAAIDLYRTDAATRRAELENLGV